MAGAVNSSLARRNVAVGGADLAVFEGGSGRPLLYLHDGTGLAPAEKFLALLARRFRVVAPLHPGFGSSALPGWMNAIDDFAHVHLALARSLALDGAIVVGASIGGWVAAEMATKDTHFIARLVLIAPVGIKVGPVDRLDIPDIFAMPRDELDRRLFADPAAFRLDAAAKSDAELAEIAQDWETLALVTWEPFMHNPKLKHRLGAIDRPTLLLRGAADGIVSADYARSFQQLIPGAVLQTIDGAGHLPHVERPEQVIDSIVRVADR